MKKMTSRKIFHHYLVHIVSRYLPMGKQKRIQSISRARFSEIPRETDGKRVRGDDKSFLVSAKIFTAARGRALFCKSCRFPRLRPLALRLKKIMFVLFCKASAKNNKISFYCGTLFP